MLFISWNLIWFCVYFLVDFLLHRHAIKILTVLCKAFNRMIMARVAHKRVKLSFQFMDFFLFSVLSQPHFLLSLHYQIKYEFPFRDEIMLHNKYEENFLAKYCVFFLNVKEYNSLHYLDVNIVAVISYHMQRMDFFVMFIQKRFFHIIIKIK
jgi:hypothetical protein